RLCHRSECRTQRLRKHRIVESCESDIFRATQIFVFESPKKSERDRGVNSKDGRWMRLTRKQFQPRSIAILDPKQRSVPDKSFVVIDLFSRQGLLVTQKALPGGFVIEISGEHADFFVPQRDQMPHAFPGTPAIVRNHAIYRNSGEFAHKAND